jgi:GH15 family glucan-1,4-alpha-glucosidase
MAAPIEDYALLSDLATGPLISGRGSVDWPCFPRFDSPSVFAALLGNEDHGRWLLAPAEPDAVVVSRHYLESTFVLETTWRSSSGQIRVTDLMPPVQGRSSVLRRVTGIHGTVSVRQELSIRPQYGAPVPWMSRIRRNTSPGSGDALLAIAGPDAWALQGPHCPRPMGTSAWGISRFQPASPLTLN